MAQVFTYFYSDGTSQIRTQPEGPLPSPGEVWVRGAYTPPDFPSPLNVRVGKAGIKVWMLIHWLRLSDEDPSTLRARFAPDLSDEDIEAARWFYKQNRDEIDRRIREEMEAA